MHLAIFIHSLSSGGAERVTTNLANHWASKGWTVTIITMTSEDTDFYDLHPAIKRVTLALDGDSTNIFVAVLRNVQRVIALRKWLKRIQPDIALAMMSTANILLALATMGMRSIQTVGSERTHCPAFPLSAPWSWLRKHTYGRLDVVVALTQKTAKWIKNNTTAQSVVVIPNSVPFPLVVQRPIVPVIELGGNNMLLAAGRLGREKGFDMLIAAFGQLAEKHPDWTLVIVGKGSERQSLETQIQDAQLANRVLLPGLVGNIGQWYEAASLYVMSSRFEGFPNTLVEAMAHGVPAVSFDCDTGPSDIIRHEVDGLLVPAGNGAALAHSLDRMMSNAALRKQFAIRATETQSRFSVSRVANMWEQIFQEIKDGQT